MRIMIKGGVWKNTEDEILKAAVMKYGLNQWARISSLLVRKSAKQCKARWYEWLDPSIRKTEWTREEDEKLLHLAKLMPCQWRTIAPIVGRTPAQCLERYEKLLDMAVSKEDRYDPRDDPRRLRPGEIDPNPESKPARPDAVDMDEDEKEMLSEARARLANTRGKKAKRKAREKQLEEARRLAALQKKRELKAAGIELRGHNRRRGVDYNAEVPFEQKPQAGFYDTAEEIQMTREVQQEFRPVTVEDLEGKRRKDVEEALMKQDAKRQKLQERHDAPGAALRDLEESGLPRRRTKMMLPAPQVSEHELEEIARLQQGGGLEAGLVEGAGGEATRQLLGEYGPTPLHLPTRTPRTAAGQGGDRIMQEAQALARLHAMETPLMGGENMDLSGMDFSGITPRNTKVPATPNPLAGAATPSLGGGGGGSGLVGGGATARRAIAGVAATPSVAGTPLRAGAMGPPGSGLAGATPLRTPIRDQLGLNDMDALAASEDKRAERLRQQEMRNELRSALASIPAPQNEYQIMAPEVPVEDEEEAGPEEDAADVKARRLREEEERRAEEERKKSKALQRQLPRPASLDRVPRPPQRPPSQLSLKEQAEALVAAEVAALLEHDAAKYPVKEAHRKKGDKSRPAPSAAIPPLPDFPETELQAAAQLLALERDLVQERMGHAGLGPEEYVEAWQALRKDLVWLPGKGHYDRAASATPQERIESTKAEFDLARSEMEREAKRAAKLEQKVNILVGGLQGRDDKLQGEIAKLHTELQHQLQEYNCFKVLSERELRAAPERIEAMRELLQAQRTREAALQDRYKQAMYERDELRQAVAAAASSAAPAIKA